MVRSQRSLDTFSDPSIHNIFMLSETNIEFSKAVSSVRLLTILETFYKKLSLNAFVFGISYNLLSPLHIWKIYDTYLGK